MIRRYAMGEHMTDVKFYRQATVDDNLLEFAVIVARHQGKWIFCMHKDRNTFEIPGGHREPGESIEQTAYRELSEETGCLKAQVKPVGIYHVKTDEWIRYGKLFFAEVSHLGPLSSVSEIRQIVLLDNLPNTLTYPQIHTQLFQIVQGWLNMQSNCDELWDVYDEFRSFTGKTHRRGDFLADGDYQLVVHVWMVNSRKEFLITKRSPNKGFPNMWETTGGSAIAGDDSLTAAMREVSEETGLTLRPECGKLVISYQGKDHFTDVWLFMQDFELNNVVLLEGETCDVKYVTASELLQLRDDSHLIKYRYLDELIQMI